jgi:hypothetical protein
MALTVASCHLVPGQTSDPLCLYIGYVRPNSNLATTLCAKFALNFHSPYGAQTLAGAARGVKSWP